MNMASRATTKTRRTQKTQLDQTAERAWFLLDSDWHDVVWVFKPTNVLEENRRVRIDWNFTLPSGRRFTDVQYASLLESSRQLIAVIRAHSLSTGLALRASTAAGYFIYLRKLVRWMDEAGFTRFADLDAQALLQFQSYLAGRPGTNRVCISPVTVQKYLYLFIYLYRFSAQIDDGLRFDPFPGRSIAEVAGARETDNGRWPYTPDTVAVALIRGCMDLIDHGAALILQARTVYSQSMATASQKGYCFQACNKVATRALRQAGIVIPSTGKQILSVGEFARLVDMLYAACFVVISYLVGPRASEILHLHAGCVQKRGDVGVPLDMIVGTIFKRQPEYHGRPHEWVAPPMAIQAITVLEMLSAPHREQAHSPNLWLRRRKACGANEWRSPCSGTLEVISTERMQHLLARLAIWLDLPRHEGKIWKLSTHQGRKTFARFAALRDRSALFALAQQFGHRERAVTDHGYSGSDYRLNEEIEAEIMVQSVSAWEHMLAAPGLGGRAGAEIIDRRPRFRGARLKQDIKSYARMLVEAGLVLGVCDWGFCVRREESSACLGNAAGPNPARREPSTCVRCANFAISSKHRSYWSEQVHQCEVLLDEPSLPLQTLRILRERMQEAQTLIRIINQSSERGGDEQGNYGRPGQGSFITEIAPSANRDGR